jgi:hypothetical protein
MWEIGVVHVKPAKFVIFRYADLRHSQLQLSKLERSHSEPHELASDAGSLRAQAWPPSVGLVNERFIEEVRGDEPAIARLPADRRA